MKTNFKELLKNDSYRNYGTPFIISSGSLNCTFDELSKTLEEGLKNIGFLKAWRNKPFCAVFFVPIVIAIPTLWEGEAILPKLPN